MQARLRIAAGSRAGAISARPAVLCRAALTKAAPAATGRVGDRYVLTEEQKIAFERDGYVHLPGLMSAEEMDELEATYNLFLEGKAVDLSVLGKDFCDMSQAYGQDLSKFNIVNIMLPSKHYPPLRGCLYERRAASVAEQLHGPDMVVDYDQLLAKPPNKPGAVFHWHQDLAYWPVTPDTRTASFWLSVDESREETGCIRFVPGTHKEANLRPHKPLYGDRSKSHTLVAQLGKGDVPRLAEIKRGDATVHNERILHGSGGNTSLTQWRRAYVMAYRSRDTVARERAMGFTHSHNDDLDVLNKVGKE